MKSIKLVNKLECHPLYILPFGSSIYGTEPNDYDLIYIIPEDTGKFIFQYKDETTKEDITYVGLQAFLDGLKNCSNVEFFEALHTSAGDKFLLDNNLDLQGFYTNRIVKAYLGYAKRDLDFFEKRLYYIVKSIIIAQIIVDKKILDPEYLDQHILYELKHKVIYENKYEVKNIINEMRKKLTYGY